MTSIEPTEPNRQTKLAYGFISAGIILLILLVVHLVMYMDDFTQHPIHQYLAELNPESKPIQFGDTTIIVPDGYFKIAALFFGFWMVAIWINLAKTIIEIGCHFLPSNKRKSTTETQA